MPETPLNGAVITMDAMAPVAPPMMPLASIQQVGHMQTFDPMARALSVAPFYSMAYLGGIAQLAKAAVASRLYGELNESQATMILQTGMEMGIAPTVALRNIGSFKGKTCISGQLMLGLVKAAGYDVDITENTAALASLTIQKPGKKPHTAAFSYDEAKVAGYPDRNALYKTIPATMILNRAIGLCCRYGAPEVAAGLYTNEEGMDIQDAPVAPRPSETQPPAAPVVSMDRGGAAAGSTTPIKAKPAKVAPAAVEVPPTTAPAPLAPPPGTFRWTDTRKEWLRARAAEMGVGANEIDAALIILDTADDSFRWGYTEAIKTGDIIAARAVIAQVSPILGADQQ